MSHFDAVKVQHILRSQNKHVDRLTGLASNYKYVTRNQLPVSHPTRPSMEDEPNIQVCTIEPKDDWRTSIIEFLKMGSLPINRGKARKLKLQANQYTLIGDILYKRSFTMPYLRCLSPAEADYAMREIHEGICINHLGSQSLVHKLVRARYYWPTMHAKSANFVRKCDSCQRFTNIPR